MPDGWFRTGDVGELDADGCLFLRGRTKDVINVLGMKFFPQEVEAVLASHPAVAGACVLARHDERLGEVPIARVLAKADANGHYSAGQLLGAARRRHWHRTKCPETDRVRRRTYRGPASSKVLHRERSSRRAETERAEGHLLKVPRPSGGPLAERRELNAADRALLAVNQSLRVRENRRLWKPDIPGTRRSSSNRQPANRDCTPEPAVSGDRRATARRRGKKKTVWRFRSDACCVLREETLASPQPNAVLNRAAQLLATPLDLQHADPLRFHLLRRPDGRDAAVVRYNHTLMDNRAALALAPVAGNRPLLPRLE